MARTLAIINDGNQAVNYIVQDDDDSYVAPNGFEAIDVTGWYPLPMTNDVWDGVGFVRPDETKWDLIRMDRDRLLTESDKEVLSDRWASMDGAAQTAWSDYRQALRDLPQTFAGDPDGVVWPAKP